MRRPWGDYEQASSHVLFDDQLVAKYPNYPAFFCKAVTRNGTIQDVQISEETITFGQAHVHYTVKYKSGELVSNFIVAKLIGLSWKFHEEVICHALAPNLLEAYLVQKGLEDVIRKQ